MHIYILTNKHHTVFYVGVTNNLVSRMHEHIENECKFTARYNVKKLVYYETRDNPLLAIEREKYLKKKSRKWKIELISKYNPEWKDLFVNGNLIPLKLEL